MGKKIYYEPGQVLNEETGCQYLQDVDTPQGQPRKALCLCSCGKEFIGIIKFVKKGSTCLTCAIERTRAAKIKYHEGDTLNARGTKLIEKLDTKKGILECGECHKHYVSSWSDAARLNSTCHDCASKRGGIKREIYCVGEEICAKNGLKYYFKKELPSVYREGGHKRRRGIFYLIDENGKRISKDFEARLTSVAHGDVTGKNFSAASHLAKETLDSLGIKYTTEATFSDLVNPKTERRLKVDFLTKNTIPRVALEIDGEQHFKPVEYFGGEENFNSIRQRDEIKNKYFEKKEGYILLRIRPEKIKDLEEYLKQNLLDVEIIKEV